MGTQLINFCDINGDLRYVNLNNVEVLKFADSPNIVTEKLHIRYKSGTVIIYELRKHTTETLKKRLNDFL